MIPLILVGALLTAPAAPQAQKQAEPEFTLTIAGPTYGADGHVSGGKRSVELQLGAPVTYYQYSRATLCLAGAAESADDGVPDDAGYGWKVRVTPLRAQDNKLVMRVEWQRMWNGGSASAGVQHERELTLANGASVTLDYLSATNSSTKCDAVGMGLQVGVLEHVDESVAVSTLQTDVWLVNQFPDGTETSQHQMIRAKVGDATPYYFDDLHITTPQGDGTIRISGHISPVVVNGQVSADLFIARKYLVNGAAAWYVNATDRIDPKVGEVLSFDLPMPQLAGHTLSLRVKTIQIR